MLGLQFTKLRFAEFASFLLPLLPLLRQQRQQNLQFMLMPEPRWLGQEAFLQPQLLSAAECAHILSLAISFQPATVAKHTLQARTSSRGTVAGRDVNQRFAETALLLQTVWKDPVRSNWFQTPSRKLLPLRQPTRCSRCSAMCPHAFFGVSPSCPQNGRGWTLIAMH